MGQGSAIRNRKGEIHVGGMFFEGIGEVGNDPTTRDETTPQYGADWNRDISEVTGGTLRLRAWDSIVNRRMERALIGRNPTTYVPGLAIRPNNAIIVPVWQNYRSEDDQNYTDCIYYGGWAPPATGREQGGADDTRMPDFSGRCDIANKFIDGSWCYGEKVALTVSGGGFTATCTKAFTTPPEWIGHAVDVWALKETTGYGDTGLAIQIARLIRGATRLSAANHVTLTADDVARLPEEWDGQPTHVFVIKLSTAAGTNQSGLPFETHTLWTDVT